MNADEYVTLGGRLDPRQVRGWYERMESIEIDEDFLCFTDLYAPASRLVPSDWTVVDLGGYVGIQAGLFKGRYVDVDCYDLMGDDIYLPPPENEKVPRPSGRGWSKSARTHRAKYGDHQAL